MSAFLFLAILIGYVLILVAVSYWKGGDGSNDTFFTGKRESPWPLVAFGMIGASLSGVTFLSIPGTVAKSSFDYMQLVLGYLPGYLFIAFVLIPVYYKLNLTTIYGYLEQRFGVNSYKIGSAFFILSRLVGATLRIFLVVVVLQLFIFDEMKMPFALTTALTIFIIWVYTFRSGIKAIVWTDTLQTVAMLAAVLMTIAMISQKLGLSIAGLIETVQASEMSKTFFFENGWSDKQNFFKKFLGGASIAIVMTGLDQDMMQKNLTCKSPGDAQKNVVTLSLILIPVNLLFLFLGASLYIFAEQQGISLEGIAGDKVFPMLAKESLGLVGAIIFFIGVIAAAFSSADSALTALTTTFCVDFLNFDKQKLLQKENYNDKKSTQTRRYVHIGFSIVFFLMIIAFNQFANESVINDIFKFAGYTYGPLMALFFMGLFTKIQLRDKWVPLVCISGPVISHFLRNLIETNTSYKFDFEFLIFNTLITALGLLMLSKRMR
jgi:Na+/proline symporter